MKKFIIQTIAAISLACCGISAGAQVLQFTAADASPVTLAKGSAGLTETGTTAYSAFGNAAAILFSKSSIDIAAGYTAWQPAAVSSNIINVGGSYKMNGKIGVALGVSYGANPSYTVTDENGIATGSFNPSDIQMNAAFAYRFSQNVAVGANIGYANSSLAEDHNYSGMMADVYVMTRISDLKIAAGVSNLGSKIKSATGKEFSLPTSISVGAGYEMKFASIHSLDVSADADYYFNCGAAVAAGLEYGMKDAIFARGGFRYSAKSPVASFGSLGVGVKISDIKIDLTYIMASRILGNSLSVGIGYSF